MKTRLGIVGATGLVGQTIIGMLENEDLEFEAIRFFASKDTVGEIIHFKGVDYEVEELVEEDFKDLDYAMFAIDDSISEYYAPMALKHKVRVIDNSNAFRMDEDVPLVVPEVNFHHIKDEHMIIANPNCTTIQSVVALEPIIEKYGAKRIIYSTYQAVSGSGVAGIEDLERGYRGEAPLNYPVEIVGNVIPQIDSFVEDGDTKEEKKMIEETKKILGRYDIGVTATNVRVPVKNGHSVAINIETEKDFDIEEVRRSYIDFEGITYTDYEDRMKYATPKDANGRDDVLVSRIRKDPSIDRGINLWSVGDNLRKGAAGNAVQILIGLINS